MATDMKPAKTVRSSGTSMIVRILAFVFGTPIFLLGLLATYVAFDQMLNPAPGKQYPLPVYMIGIAIMAVPVAVGAILLKVALLPKNSGKRANPSPSTRTTPQRRSSQPRQPSVQPSVPVPSTPPPALREPEPAHESCEEAEMNPTNWPEPAVATDRESVDIATLSPAFGASTLPPAGCAANADGTGELVAQCGPKKSGQTHYIAIGVFMIMLGCVAMAIPTKILPPKKPADEGMIRTAGLCFGGVMTLFGIGMMAGPLLGATQTIRLYDNKLVEEKGNRTREIGFDQITSVQIQEWYEHRFAPQTFNVKVKVVGQPDVAFSSALVGDSERIIGFLAEHTSDVQMSEFAELAC